MAHYLEHPCLLTCLDSLHGELPKDLECLSRMEYVDVSSIPQIAGNVSVIDDDDYWDSEEAGWDIESLIGALNELCPPFVYFGTHPGDGADYGFWPDMDGLEEAVNNARGHACCLKLPDDSVCLPDDGLVVQVSDHGNVTVMDRDSSYHVIWSVV